jgi:hypothetical protein
MSARKREPWRGEPSPPVEALKRSLSFSPMSNPSNTVRAPADAPAHNNANAISIFAGRFISLPLSAPEPNSLTVGGQLIQFVLQDAQVFVHFCEALHGKRRLQAGKAGEGSIQHVLERADAVDCATRTSDRSGNALRAPLRNGNTS